VNRAPLLLILLFLVSGATGLVYQVVWARELELLLGCSTLATSAVLTAFMGGFALGARLLGGLSDRVRRPLALYGLLELGIGLLALAVPLVISGVGPFYARAARLTGSTGGLSLLRFAVSVLALLAPTALMGASLPAIVAEATRRGHGVAASVGRLYAANLAGAIAGALLAGFVLIRLLGLTATNRLAAVASLAVAAVAIGASRGRELPAPAAAHGASGPGDALGPLLAPLLFLSGAVILALEVIWTRLLVFALGSTVYGFAVVLSSTLLGLALGAGLAGRVLRDPLRRLAWAHGLLAVSAMGGLLVAPWLFDLMLALSKATGTSGVAFLVASYLAAALVLLVPATVGGVVFPALTALAAARERGRGGAVGRAQATNGLGAVLGAFASGLVLIPGLGLEGSLFFLAGVELLAALLLVLRAGSRFGTALVISALVLCHALLVLGSPDRRDALDGVLRAESGGSAPRLIAYREGPVATVSVLETAGGRSLRIDGFEAAAIGGSYRYMRLMGLAPLLLHEAPRDALVICFGTGTTAGTVARDHRLEHLDIVELEPNVLDLAPYFEAKNGGVLRSPIVKTHVEDGRAFLVAAPPASLDLVTLEPLPPTHAGVVALYSREFYALAARALRPGGVACQWVPTQFLREIDTREIVATFASVFPDSVLLLLDTTGILVGTNGARQLLDRGALEARLAAAPELRGELAACGLAGADGLIATCALDAAGVARFSEGAALITDDMPRIEYAPPRHRHVDLWGTVTPWQYESLSALVVEGLRPAPALGPIDTTRRLALAAFAARLDDSMARPERAAARFHLLAPELAEPRARASAYLGAAQYDLRAGLRDAAVRELDLAAKADATHPGLGPARAALGLR
jgi:predicted membrane-bound spermidine synthase